MSAKLIQPRAPGHDDNDAESSITIPGVRILQPKIFEDDRGSFTEIWNRQTAASAGIVADFLQDNLAVSHRRGTLRGLHFQRPPAAQAKLVRVLTGAIVDFVVDLRHGGPTYGRSMAVRLDAVSGRQIYVPEGCAHGYCTLEDNTAVLYKVNAYYAPACEMGLAAHDPALGLNLPFPPEALIVNERDRNYPKLAELPVIFRWAD